ncbi:MAG: bifunctional phosphoribosylaminoimidazolecarboxamide formyltransferase/IMP cyclohydrolase [Hymenobacteraceae bacterium]|nr:bifunctional phosphoribosylaminoimidazolecarboxamide formyltransferase/IMP cyclohydrolase [Hymenobacteraceae bacterium]MDX5396859.1 bifunctional phosphoribosylaminoimidazolecarboxamide formyltransferase/IMP cyclohydrolase [Hymenobacteraceae bacterium]MDX5444394.1 bifunctional phosphoribosylaminoimidazolecarboxamide formyltransferase/IMP cyclohydrolase [Hymenobacteraceae bacterium]MDX5512932.1 bifunctional phosphoribosylaminoimidazolecarboxamide formyltransferase/IMP cyclohydrolase [Hymenobact
MQSKKIESALISVYYKDQLEPIVELLKQHGVKIYSTGGTQAFLEEQGADVTAVEDVTDYPSIFGGRVKTLHPKVFGGILHRRDNESDLQEREQYAIPPIDLVIVDLYPFEETVASGASEADVIEKIDIGGISLIRAAAKNFKDVLIVSSREQYTEVAELLQQKNGATDLEDRKKFAAKAFNVSSHYDTHIFNYLNSSGEEEPFKHSIQQKTVLRYGENPHQKGTFYGDLEAMFEQLNGKQLSYNNLVDIDAAVALMAEFTDKPAFAILKHTNACGVAVADSAKEAYLNALSCDPISAFGGVIISNKPVDLETAEELNKLFFEVLIAPAFEEDALQLLRSKKNRILLKQNQVELSKKQFKTLLNGVIEQDKDLQTETEAGFKTVTNREPSDAEKRAMVFAAKVCKHTKSNTIVLAKENQLLASGVGQTSRVDALKQAIEKAKSFGFDLQGAVMASDAFFPFPDCVEIADKAGIVAVVQPGGSIKDQDSIDYCNNHNMAMVMTGVRHFKH